MADTEFGPDRDDTGGVQLLVAAVVVALDVVHVDGLGDAGDLIEVANPGKLNMASPGSGDWAPYGERAVQAHIRHHHGSRTLSRLGADAERLHRRSLAFDGIASSIGHIRAGRLRALGVGHAARVEALPDVPAVAEFVPGYEASGTQGLGAPRNTPAEIIDLLNREINAGLADPRIRAGLTDLGNAPLPLSPAEYAKLLADETEKWGKVIRSANIKAE
jgi:tripartite-type tricarboxylate transporter receptor subunit TctC